MIVPTGMTGVMLGCAGIDGHAADRVLDRVGTIFMAMMGGSGVGHLSILFDLEPYTLWGYV